MMILRRSGSLRFLAGLAVWLASQHAAPAHADAVSDWHALAVPCIQAHRAGPPSLLDLALVQAAVHDAVQAVQQRYEPFLTAPPATGRESPAAAAASAAYHVLAAICPNSLATLDAAYQPYLDGNDPGLAVGAAVAATYLPERRPSPTLDPFVGDTAPGSWRPTPPGNLSMAFLLLATARPFGLSEPAQFRPGPQPSLESRAYAREYEEVRTLGAVESHPATPMCPAPARTDRARFWSGNFITLWHDTVRQIGLDAQLSLGRNARLLALFSIAAADTVIAVWDSKLHYDFWRPITAIREGDADLNEATVGDPSWTPFIQSAHFPSGSQTPNYPEYVSGANGLTGVATGMLQLFFHTDRFEFEVFKATAPSVVVCTNPRSFERFSDAAREVVDARIWQGIHFRSADERGRRLGVRIAEWTYEEYLRPLDD